MKEERWPLWIRYIIFAVIAVITFLAFIVSAKICIIVSLNSHWIIALFVFIVLLEIYVNGIMSWFVKVLEKYRYKE